MSELAPPHEKNQSAVSGDRPVVSYPDPPDWDLHLQRGRRTEQM